MWDSLTGQPLTTCARGVLSQPTTSPKAQVGSAPSNLTRAQRRLRHSSSFRKFNASLQAEEPVVETISVEESSVLPSIWAVDIAEDLILFGCDNGRVEVQYISNKKIEAKKRFFDKLIMV